MKFRKYLFIYIIVILLFSCNKKKNYDTNVQQKTEQKGLNEPVIKIEAIKDNDLNKLVPLNEEIKKII